MGKLKSDIFLYRVIDSVLQFIFRLIPQNKTTEGWALYWGFRFRSPPKVVKLRTGELIKVDPTDYLQCLIYYFGMFEPQCINLYKTLINENDIIFDIGGNIGLYSLVGCSEVGKNGHIYTFEPAPFHCESIKNNAAINGIENITINQMALSDKVGNSKLSLPKNSNSGGYTIANLDSDEGKNIATEVFMTTLDQYVYENSINLNKLSLIKMDIEGAEMLALKGMTETLKILPSILIEINNTALNRFNFSSEDLCNFFRSLGYKGWIIDYTDKLTELNSSNIEFAETIWIHRTNNHHLQEIKKILD